VSLLRRVPFRHRVTLILMMISGCALLVACCAFVIYDVVTFRQQMVTDLRTVAEIIGDNCTAALTFNDRHVAEEILGALRAKPNITSADLFRGNGQPFASYPPGRPLTLERGDARPDDAAKFTSDSIVLGHSILLDGEPAGRLVLRSNLHDLSHRLHRHGAAIGSVLLGCVIITFLLSWRLQTVVSRPIVELAHTARTVSANQDFSLRALSEGSDEVADLTRSFNEMLSQIQERDRALQQAHDELEARVAERTRQLRQEIVERQQTEEALRASEEKLRQSQKMEAVGRLAGGIAHDFNNLLTVITGYGQILLARMHPGEPLRTPAEEIGRASARAASLTRQLLAFSRKQLLEPKVIEINGLVSNIGTMLRRVIGEDIQLISDLDPGAGWVKADPGQLEQVLLNLAVNARDAMPQGGRLTIATGARSIGPNEASPDLGLPAGPYVVIRVTDTGMGMSAEVQAQIFEPFFTTKEKGKGTGLGLSTVYGIVTQSGGMIEVESAPGRGATFCILLPQIEGIPEAARGEAATGAVTGGSETILLVEDEDMVRALAKDILKMNGYKVLEAAHGNAALDLSRAYDGPIALMLTDVVMPAMNGHELYEKLAPLRPGMRVLYMSGYAESGIVHDGAIDPGTAFISKPFTPDALAAKVRAILDAAGRN